MKGGRNCHNNLNDNEKHEFINMIYRNNNMKDYLYALSKKTIKPEMQQKILILKQIMINTLQLIEFVIPTNNINVVLEDYLSCKLNKHINKYGNFLTRSLGFLNNIIFKGFTNKIIENLLPKEENIRGVINSLIEGNNISTKFLGGKKIKTQIIDSIVAICFAFTRNGNLNTKIINMITNTDLLSNINFTELLNNINKLITELNDETFVHILYLMDIGLFSIIKSITRSKQPILPEYIIHEFAENKPLPIIPVTQLDTTNIPNTQLDNTIIIPPISQQMTKGGKLKKIAKNSNSNSNTKKVKTVKKPNK